MMKPKTAIITGASQGIGLKTAFQLIEEGWRVIGIARTFPQDLPANFSAYKLDLSDLKALPSLLKQLKKESGDVDALICNAGRGLFGSLEEIAYEEMRSLMDLNFLSQAYLIKTFLPQFKSKNSGDIILMGSEAALQGKKMGSVYCATKFALRGFAQALREECAASQVRITLINPGMVKTNFFNDLNFAPGGGIFEHIKPDDVAKVISMVLNARIGTVFDEINLTPQKKNIVFKNAKSSLK